MSVSSTLRKQQFSLDGMEDEFTFTFRALVSAPSDIKCTVTDGSGEDTDLTYTTQYTVTINSNGVGGTVTLVSPGSIGTGTLTVYRETTNTQESDYDDYNQFPADTLETDLDIRTLVAQEQSEDIARALRLPITASGTVDAELPSPEANTIIGWNSLANALENKTPEAAYTKATPAEAIAASNYSHFMTPSTTAIAITTLAPTSGSSAVCKTGTFSNTTLSSGVLVISHSLSVSTPFAVIVVVYDNNYKQILPDEIIGSQNSAEVDLTSYGSISGTWGWRAI